LSLRDIEKMLFGHGIAISYETIRRRCDKFGAGFARGLKAAHPKSLHRIASGRLFFQGTLIHGRRISRPRIEAL